MARKPSPEMVLAVASDFNVNVNHCILICDKISDVLAGLQAGIPKVVLVGVSERLILKGDGVASIESAADTNQALTLVARLHKCDSLCLGV